MNIHEYQAKALLKSYRRCRSPKACRSSRRSEAEAAAKALPGPLYVVKCADPCRRPRQGQVQGTRPRRQGRRAAGQVGGRSRRQRQGDARPHAGDQADRRRPASRSTASTSRTAPISRASSICSLLVDRDDRPGRVRRVDRRRHGHRDGRARHAREDHHRRHRSDQGRDGGRCRQALDGALKLDGDAARGRQDAVPGALQGLRRQGHEPARGQPADRHEGRPSARARRQGVVRQQRAVPPPRPAGAARHHRRGRQGDRGVASTTSPMWRSTAISAAWSTAPASPWRRWTSSSSMAKSRRTSSMSAAARRKEKVTAAFKIITADPDGQGHPGQHLRRHHALRRHRRGRGRRGARKSG